MPFHFIYRDFLKFLDALDHQDAWEAYEKYYLRPHRKFLESYWRTFRWMDIGQIRDRVKKVKRGDYSTLVSLLKGFDLESEAEGILSKCTGVIEAPQEPEVYFMVGFFSADGFVIELGGKPVIGFGLERFKSWRALPIIFAHEYGHYLRHLWRSDEPYFCDGSDLSGRSLLAEGLSTAFSERAFPEYPLREYLFFTQERLCWCQENEEYLWQALDRAFKGEVNFTIFWRGDADLDIPPRAGNYLGYRLVKEYLMRHREIGLRSLLELKEVKLLL